MAACRKPQVEYGVMLFKGEGVAVDESKCGQAVPPRRRAGQCGRPEPARAALCQWRGGEGRSRSQAAKWHLLAREAGVSDFTLDIMLAKLTKEQRAEAEKAADDWRDGRLSE